MGEHTPKRGFGGVDNWQHFPTLKDRLSYAVMNEEFTDTVFLVGSKKERIQCNKLMLCVSSPVFATMLCNRWHPENTEIVIPDVEPPAFRIFLKYLYTEEIKRRQVQELMTVAYLAKKYDVPKLAEKCISQLKLQLNTGNAATIFQKARLLTETCLQKMASEFICRNAKRVFAVDDYLSLTLENLAYFLGMDELKIDELSLITAVYKWAQEECKREELEVKPENYRIVLKDCVELLRFPLLTAEEFTFQVIDKGILCDSDVIAILKYHSISGSKVAELPELNFNSTPRTPLFSNTRYSVLRYRGVKPNTQHCEYSTWKNHCFQVNRPISIVSIGFFGPCEKVSLPVNYDVDIRIHDNELKNCLVNIRRSVALNLKTYGGRIFQVEFDSPIKVNPFVWYTISFLLKGPTTYMGDERKSEIKIQCGFDEVTFKFKDAKSSNSIFQIPELCFILF